MKKLILNLEHDYISYIFVIVGIVLLCFPNIIINYVHIILSILLILFCLFNLFGYFYYDDHEVNIGKLVIYLILSVVMMLEKANDLHTLGVMWSMVSLTNVSEEINEFLKHHEFSLFRLIMIITTLTLSMMLLIDPNHHFSSHIQILGIELIFTVFIRKHHLKSGD